MCVSALLQELLNLIHSKYGAVSGCCLPFKFHVVSPSIHLHKQTNVDMYILEYVPGVCSDSFSQCQTGWQHLSIYVYDVVEGAFREKNMEWRTRGT